MARLSTLEIDDIHHISDNVPPVRSCVMLNNYSTVFTSHDLLAVKRNTDFKKQQQQQRYNMLLCLFFLLIAKVKRVCREIL